MYFSANESVPGGEAAQSGRKHSRCSFAHAFSSRAAPSSRRYNDPSALTRRPHQTPLAVLELREHPRIVTGTGHIPSSAGRRVVLNRRRPLSHRRSK